MDTVFALASAPGKAGVAVVRISGPKSWDAVEALSGQPVTSPRYASLKTLRDPAGDFIDQVLVIAFEKGASFTGERVAEFHLHGSTAVVKAVLRLLGDLPQCRTAEPGEFTRRALENGCLDLTQVEALADLIDSETEAQRKQALTVLTGALSKKVGAWREKLVRSAALLEATIDFVDEDVPVDVAPEVTELLSDVLKDVESELSGLDAAERIRSGYEVAIVGPPNAGKSTLLNFLAGREAAITSELAGTTRDIIEVKMDVFGIAVTFLDTAGLRDTDDVVEKIGVERAKHRAESADLRVHLLVNDEGPLVAVKSDDLVLKAKQDSGGSDGVSGLTGHGVPQLLEHIRGIFSERMSSAGLASNERHRENLSGGRVHLLSALDAMGYSDSEADLISEDIRIAIRYLETMVGKVDVEHLLGEIFSSFCIGK
ncbi:tRNA uridine-5-carboxymethylaminomethyl(34) synthesis GTPase MnmE [Sagittula sp. S175]|uniref:tRNA uridine-5-carboxymethylaminomethyl(34) synthesis GTPase MnmE n=1 Tax=Sagittula sp. S175 TaxID=3415129 RepID=UPI003C7E9975